MRKLETGGKGREEEDRKICIRKEVKGKGKLEIVGKGGEVGESINIMAIVDKGGGRMEEHRERNSRRQGNLQGKNVCSCCWWGNQEEEERGQQLPHPPASPTPQMVKINTWLYRQHPESPLLTTTTTPVR